MQRRQIINPLSALFNTGGDVGRIDPASVHGELRKAARLSLVYGEALRTLRDSMETCVRRGSSPEVAQDHVQRLNRAMKSLVDARMTITTILCDVETEEHFLFSRVARDGACGECGDQDCPEHGVNSTGSCNADLLAALERGEDAPPPPITPVEG